MSKYKKGSPNDKGFDENVLSNFKFDKETAVFANGDTLNSFGLDLTNPDIIKYEDGNLVIEVIGGIHDVSLNQVKVGLKIQKKYNQSPMEVYRTQSIELLNENQVDYLIRNASDKVKVESIRLKEAMYALIQKLEDYKRHKLYASPVENVPSISAKTQKEVKEFLKHPDLVNQLMNLLDLSGQPDPKLAFKLLLISLSRMTGNPLHTILQGQLLLSDECCKAFGRIVPDERLKELATLSPTALSYSPYPNYWDKKLVILHQLEGALSKKDSTLQEYMTNDRVSRVVTEVNHRNGTYNSNHKSLHECFSILGFTSKDFHVVFNSQNVICLPLTNTTEMKKRITSQSLKGFGGHSTKQMQNSIELLQSVQRVLQPIPVVNPFIDEIDFQEFLDYDIKKITLFMRLTSLVTMLHQFQLNPKKQDGRLVYEVQPNHILLVMELFKELWVTSYDELYFQIQGTLNNIKKALIKRHPDGYEDSMFTEREMQELLKMHPSTLNRHILKLTAHNKLQRVCGNNRIGFHYSVKNWSEMSIEKDRFEDFKSQVVALGNSDVSQELKQAV